MKIPLLGLVLAAYMYMIITYVDALEISSPLAKKHDDPQTIRKQKTSFRGLKSDPTPSDMTSFRGLKKVRQQDNVA